MSLRTFTAQINAGTPPFTYRWEGSADGGVEWQNLGVNASQEINDAALTHLRVTATNVAGSDTTAAFPIPPSPPVITTAALPNGEDGVAYSQQLAVNGVPGGTWSVVAGQAELDAIGLALDPNTGIITGDAIEGSASFTVRYTDPYAEFDDQALSITVDGGLT